MRSHQPIQIPHRPSSQTIHAINGSVSADAYLLRFGPFSRNSAHPKSSVVEGSSDGSTWITFDTQSDNDDLNGPHRTKTFPLDVQTFFMDPHPSNK
jgi:hypothetical protein